MSASLISVSGGTKQVERAEERAEHLGIGAHRGSEALAQHRPHERAGIVGIVDVLAGEHRARRCGAPRRPASTDDRYHGSRCSVGRARASATACAVEVVGMRRARRRRADARARTRSRAAASVERVRARVGVADGVDAEQRAGRPSTTNVRSRLSSPAMTCTPVIGRDDRGIDPRRRGGQHRGASRRTRRASSSAPRSSASSVGVASVTENVRLSPWNIAYFR